MTLLLLLVVVIEMMVTVMVVVVMVMVTVVYLVVMVMVMVVLLLMKNIVLVSIFAVFVVTRKAHQWKSIPAGLCLTLGLTATGVLKVDPEPAGNKGVFLTF